ncbi:nuclear transport factor 2 family protein [Flavihumibacter sp. CACIAM 22H1]|uniref:nuclear transport factor 2 family protein n=1 Tax=Flavihumibacter sp. CACIAM 22H1 TaxID=1812911 RepID=UPI0007A88377|nr:nuclear transport factor 2 family protein [Flavihumibacter sp. CACIAM 22H1]KYP15879.1 MAG: hypothetical protein A1D16_05965 [Flavihumibacter sp. CACIAM 22H1]
MKLLFSLVLTIVSFSGFAQKNAEEEGIKNTINQLFTAMRNRDTALLKAAFAPTAVLQTIAPAKDGSLQVRTEELAGFIKAIGTPGKDLLDERIQFGSILVDGPMAAVWTPYEFYLGTRFSHCGVNSFQLVKLDGNWKIQYIIDTRRKNGCQQ